MANYYKKCILATGALASAITMKMFVMATRDMSWSSKSRLRMCKSGRKVVLVHAVSAPSRYFFSTIPVLGISFCLCQAEFNSVSFLPRLMLISVIKGVIR